MDLNSLPGFRDFFPEEMRRRTYILGVWRDVAGRYGFEEYDGPPLEPLEIYTRKSGEEIVSQLYRFEDQGGREVALRPEMTPTFARMVGARAGGLPKPIRWFSVPQLFRYERPQKGRLREHFQLNMDIVGETDEAADAEIIAAAIDVLRAFGLTADDVVVRLSDRRVIAARLRELGAEDAEIPAILAAIDRIDKQDEAETKRRLREAGLSEEAAERVLALTTEDPQLDAFTVAEADEAAGRLRRVIDRLGAIGLGDFVQFDPLLVRGLAYYTGTVFEIWDRSGEFRAICGGGRYDDLLAALGGPDLPALGFGMGDVVLGELLEARGLLPEHPTAIEDFVVCVTPAERPIGLRAAHALRDAGRRVAYDLSERSVGRQFKAANQLGAERAIVIGPDEAAAGEALVRDLATGDEKKVGLDELAGPKT
ncbi:MAG: histidine--tRNA ligase [Gemmatimonadales bacterium]|jgi:histidyl-tRNA synthetase